MYTKTVLVRNPSGLHARPASEIVSAAKAFRCRITIARDGSDEPGGSAKSIITLLGLGIAAGETARLTAEGEDEQGAVEALATLIETGFGEI